MQALLKYMRTIERLKLSKFSKPQVSILETRYSEGPLRIVGSPTPEALAEFLKKVLHEAKAEFTVAPYSALAQVQFPYRYVSEVKHMLT